MMYIKKFIDKVSLMESKQAREVVLSMPDARGLRDELAKILAEQFEAKPKTVEEPVIKIEMKGGSFK